MKTFQCFYSFKSWDVLNPTDFHCLIKNSLTFAKSCSKWSVKYKNWISNACVLDDHLELFSLKRHWCLTYSESAVTEQCYRVAGKALSHDCGTKEQQEISSEPLKHEPSPVATTDINPAVSDGQNLTAIKRAFKLFKSPRLHLTLEISDHTSSSSNVKRLFSHADHTDTHKQTNMDTVLQEITSSLSPNKGLALCDVFSRSMRKPSDLKYLSTCSEFAAVGFNLLLFP